MRSQRGSMAVVALVMMLFLLIAGFAWLPMLAHENKTAQNDWEEQQAWYAAEAGFVRAKTELNNSADG
jgi:Tfp pilus assembly protein PilX